MRQQRLIWVSFLVFLSVLFSFSTLLADAGEPSPDAPPLGPPSEKALSLQGVSPAFTDPALWYEGGKALNEAGFKAVVTRALARPELAGLHVGFKVQDLNSGRVLLEQNAQETFNPASNMKIVSSAAALHYLGPGYRFHTRIFAKEAPDDEGVLHGDLYLVGGGDPWLVNERVSKLAMDLYNRGLRRIEGNILVDDSFFDDQREGPGWDDDATNYSYRAPLGAMSVNFNSVGVHVYPTLEVGKPARVMVAPRTVYYDLTTEITTEKRWSMVIVETPVNRKGRNDIKVRGRIHPDREQGVHTYRRIDNPPMFAGLVIHDELKLRGIRTKGWVKLGKKPKDASVELLDFESPTLGRLIGLLNKMSNNFMAEQVLKTLAAEKSGTPGTWENGVVWVSRFLVDVVGVKPGSFKLGNASGLGPVNEISPDLILRVLRMMKREPTLAPEFLSAMSVLGQDGTLRRRIADSEAKGRIRAKTGTLEAVLALSGYAVSRGCDDLVFSLLFNDGTKERRKDMAKVQDEILLALTNLVLDPNNKGCLPLQEEENEKAEHSGS